MNDSVEAGSIPNIPMPSFSGVDPFVRRTYQTLFCSLLGIIALGFVSYYLVPQTATTGLAAADGVIWIACGWFGWRRPIALVLPLFFILTGLFLGQLAHIYGHAFGLASALTIVTFGGLSAYVHVSKKSFTMLNGFLCISFFILLGGCILGAVFPNQLFSLVLAAFGTLVFGCWILYDTSRIVERTDPEFTSEIAAFELILDIVGLHRWLMNLLNLSSKD